MRGHRPSRLCVEDCVTLSVMDLHRSGVFTSPFGSRWLLNTLDGTGATVSSVAYNVIEAPGCALALRISYEEIDDYRNAIDKFTIGSELPRADLITAGDGTGFAVLKGVSARAVEGA